jgi:hypothetical protein
MIALDTNVPLYACDRADSRRQQIAIDLVANSKDGVLLWQVACEFVAASRKLSAQGFTASDAWSRLTASPRWARSRSESVQIGPVFSCGLSPAMCHQRLMPLHLLTEFSGDSSRLLKDTTLIR